MSTLLGHPHFDDVRASADGRELIVRSRATGMHHKFVHETFSLTMGTASVASDAWSAWACTPDGDPIRKGPDARILVGDFFELADIVHAQR
jgi:hypothetical protein